MPYPVRVDGQRLVIASSNAGKLRDFAGAAQAFGVEVAGLPGIERIAAPAETGTTFKENAELKAVYYSQHAPGALVAADDSGLVVAALDGEPGVYSARYAGEGAGDAANNDKLLRELERHGEAPRAAMFVCVIAFARDGKAVGTFRGEAKGEILRAARGTDGFGYDPLFYVPAAVKTFAEMDAAEKAAYSHRGAAFRKAMAWLRSQRGADHEGTKARRE